MSKEEDISYREEVVWLVPILLVASGIQLIGSLWGGYLSDDYDLLQQAREVTVLGALWGHHFSPVMNTLFRLSAHHGLPPILWHGVALVVHLINVILVFCLVRSGFHLRRSSALVSTTLFALSAAGHEALAWTCSLGYVLVLPCILLALLGVLTVPKIRAIPMGVALAVLQVCAFAIWDWGVLLFPLATVAVFMCRIRNGDIKFHHAFLMLWACGATWVALLWLKRSMGYDHGYHAGVGELILGAKMIAAAPLTGLFPNTTLTFLKSISGALCAVVIWGVLFWSAVRSRTIALALSLYFVCVLPVMLFGVLQSRYAYIAAPFLSVAVVCAIGRLAWCRLRLVLSLILIVAHALFAEQRSRMWLGASRVADELREAIESAPVVPGRDLVIVNLPDSFGPADMIWRPFVWRNGLSCFRSAIKRVNTPDCPFVWREGPIPVMEREQIRSLLPNSDVYEVVRHPPDNWRHYRLSPFLFAASDSSRQ
jgi:hypothetical protein